MYLNLYLPSVQYRFSLPQHAHHIKIDFSFYHTFKTYGMEKNDIIYKDSVKILETILTFHSFLHFSLHFKQLLLLFKILFDEFTLTCNFIILQLKNTKQKKKHVQEQISIIKEKKMLTFFFQFSKLITQG